MQEKDIYIFEANPAIIPIFFVGTFRIKLEITTNKKGFSLLSGLGYPAIQQRSCLPEIIRVT